MVAWLVVGGWDIEHGWHDCGFPVNKHLVKATTSHQLQTNSKNNRQRNLQITTHLSSICTWNISINQFRFRKVLLNCIPWLPRSKKSCFLWRPTYPGECEIFVPMGDNLWLWYLYTTKADNLVLKLHFEWNRLNKEYSKTEWIPQVNF